MNLLRLLCFAAAAGALLPAARAEVADELARCRDIPDPAQRLACYDAAVRTPAPPVPVDTSPAARAVLVDTAAPAAPQRSLLGDRWALDVPPEDSRFDLRPHRPVYFLLGRYSDAPNQSPATPTREPVELTQALDRTEAKYQISFKAKLADFSRELGMPLAIWAAYTQQSNWQIYNSGLSRPFRETDYEPELFVTTHPDLEFFGWRWRLAGLGISHQSNGRSEPLSRSWNRIVAQFGVERGDVAILFRPWIRLRESTGKDDNPDLTRYLGHSETVLVWTPGEHQFSLAGRLNADSGKGALQAHWTFPLVRRVRGIVQVFSGYGESLIDYNHRQTTIGVGISLADHL